MPDTPAKQRRCPGWPHDYYHPHHPATQAREGRGELEPICDLDREQYLAESNAKETTVPEREQQRTERHRSRR